MDEHVHEKCAKNSEEMDGSVAMGAEAMQRPVSDVGAIKALILISRPHKLASSTRCYAMKVFMEKEAACLLCDPGSELGPMLPCKRGGVWKQPVWRNIPENKVLQASLQQ